MIPIALLAGLVVGRWWAIPAIGLGWAAVVGAFGECGAGCIPVAAALGAANGAIGVVAHRAILAALTAVRR